MLKKNAELTLTVESMGMNGEGIARYDKYVIFIPLAITGERVLARILKVKNNIAFAKVIEVHTPADERVRPKCQVFGRCGGCQLQHLKYTSQIKLKSKMVKDCFYKIAGLNIDVPTAIKSDYVFSYRNKLQLPVGKDVNGEIAIGFYAENSHRIVPIDKCMIHPDWAGDVISVVKQYAAKTGVNGYDEFSKSGEIRHIAIRELGGKFIIGLVVTKELPNLSYLISLLSEKFKSFSFFLNFNTADTNVVFGPEYRLVFGPSKFEEEECGIKYFVGAETFLQVNPYIRRRLFDKVIKFSGDDVVIDAYSGGGLLTAMLAKNCRKVYGIEAVKEAVDCANELVEKNGLTDCMINVHGRVEDKLEEVIKEAGGKFTLVLDPPRKGCDRTVIEAVSKNSPEKIIYISCNPATLARDVGLLTGSLTFSGKEVVKSQPQTKRHYEIDYIQPYDMFPQTKHVETLVCLQHV